MVGLGHIADNVKVSTIGMNVSQSINSAQYLGRHMYDLNLLVDFPRFFKVCVICYLEKAIWTWGETDIALAALLDQ
jgi:hypothetical protein